jgi:hypothetical protein
VGLHPLRVVRFLGAQAGVISPLLFIAVLAACVRPEASLRSAGKRPETGYLLSLFWPLLGFYLLLSFQHTSEANWPAAAYVGGLILVAAQWDPWLFAPGQRRARQIALAAIVVAAAETAVLHDTRWLRLPQHADLLDRARGWRDLAAKVEALQRSTGAQFVIANKYMTASLLSFYLPGQPTVFMPTSAPRLNQLVLWPTYRDQHPTGDGLFVSDVPRPSPSLNEDFLEVEPLGTIDTQEGERKLNRYYAYVCRREAKGPGPGRAR